MKLPSDVSRSEPEFQRSRAGDPEIVGALSRTVLNLEMFGFSRTKQYRLQSELNAIAELIVLLHHRDVPTYTSMLGIWRAGA